MMHEDPTGKFFRLENVGSSKYLSAATKQVVINNVKEPWRDNFSALILATYDSTNSSEQKWKFRDIKDSEVAIQHYRDGRVLDVNEGSLKEG